MAMACYGVSNSNSMKACSFSYPLLIHHTKPKPKPKPFVVALSIPPNLNSNNHSYSHSLDADYIQRAAHLADKSAGFTSPHPNFGCVIADTRSTTVLGEGYLYAQGTKTAEVVALEAAPPDLCRGATAFLNMEPGDCHGDHTAVSALVQV